MSTVPARRSSPRALVLRGVDWVTYSRLLRTFAEHPAVRLTYDRGNLEIMSPLYEHETDGEFLGRLVVTMTEEAGLPIRGGGSTTLRRRARRRGLEPDRCYWIAGEPQIRARRRIDLRRDPPPDLAIEIDVTSSSLNRLAIYATLGVPEVWRLDGPALTFHVLGTTGVYAEAPRSRAFPQVAPADLLRLLGQRVTRDDNTLVAEFRAWLRQQASGSRPPSVP